jgi:putative ABC transport system substrate-binding protein
VNRRDFVLALGSLALGCAYFIQTRRTERLPRLAILLARSPAPSEILDAFRQGLRDHGYVEGKNIITEYRFTGDKYDRLASLTTELLDFKPDVIFTHTTPGALAVKRATTTIPIVIGAAGDLIESGIVVSLAKPHTNITGLCFVTLDLHQKRLELLKKLIPNVSRVAVLVNSANPLWNAYPVTMQDLARKLGLELVRFEARNSAELETAFSGMAKMRAEAVLAVSDTIFDDCRREIADLSVRNRLPVISEIKQFAEAGCLAAYGVDIPAMFRQAAFYVDKILGGARAQELPIERPMRAEFVINLKTAIAMGINIPPEILQRADNVIT